MSLRERHIKALRKKAKLGFAGYPVATIAFYGPTDKLATKVAVGILENDGEDAKHLERWFSEATDIRSDHAVMDYVLAFIRTHGVKSVALTDRIIGCPHEEGIDYPENESCPNCPFWAGRNRWTGELEHPGAEG